MKLSLAIRMLFAALILSSAALAWACFWDSDTLRTEANGMPGVVEAVTGFFPVYPDEYYERRIEIAEERLAADPDRLASYDDIAVSHDRLGDSTAAIASMTPKLGVIERLGDDAGDHLYRYHANIGTFHAHRWIRGGGDAEDMTDLEAAREHIAKAIEINPDAHFGREFVQLGAIEWLLDDAADDEENCWHGDYPTMLSKLIPVEDINDWQHQPNKAVTEGLVGLVVLGAAWQSTDVLTALAIELNNEQQSSLALVCMHRIDELLGQGRKSLHPTARPSETPEYSMMELFEMPVTDRGEIAEYYATVRQEAGEFRESYSSFVKQRLVAGLHPDTHKDFFEGAPVPLLSEAPNGFFGYTGTELTNLKIQGVLIGIGVVAVASVCAAIWFFRKKLWISTPAP
jgi:tetratricopeptide (TPR) repeat protein